MSGTITILGTQHNTKDSFQLARESIPDRQPDVVAVELPPRYFQDGTPNWSLTAALHPAQEETLTGLLTQRLMIDDDYWQIDEMPLASQVAVDENIPVALIDQPFPKSMDEAGRAIVADTRRNLRTLAQEWHIHRSHLSENRWQDLLERDLWRFGMGASPILRFQYELYKKGLRNPLDEDQWQEIKADVDRKTAVKQMDAARPFLSQFIESNIDRRDEKMAGHLRWLADQDNDVLVFVGLGHVEYIRQCLEGERQLREKYVAEPTFAAEVNILQN